MQYSTNLNMNLPERADQYRLSHWNENTDIIDNAMQAIRSGTDDVMRATLLNFCYPVGSIYWSGNPTNPHDLFGGTWVQIKDKFIWAKGDNDTLNATGGEKTHTLTASEIPSHNHSFTPAGSISVTTNPTFTGSEHSHTYTPAGSISVTTNPTFKGSEVTSGANNRGHTHSVGAHSHGLNEHTHSFSGSASHSHNFAIGNVFGSSTAGQSPVFALKWAYKSSNITASSTTKNIRQDGGGNGFWLPDLDGSGKDVATLQYTSKGVNYDRVMTYIVTQADTESKSITISGTTGKASGNTANSTAFDSGGESQNHTHKVTASGSISGGAYKFTGTQATLKATASGSISGGAYKFTGSAGTTGSKGDGSAHNNMPPYIVKYCWERTA